VSPLKRFALAFLWHVDVRWICFVTMNLLRVGGLENIDELDSERPLGSARQTLIPMCRRCSGRSAECPETELAWTPVPETPLQSSDRESFTIGRPQCPKCPVGSGASAAALAGEAEKAPPQGVTAGRNRSVRVGISDVGLFREGFWATVPGPSGLVP
jgi:hypothetical protein